MRTVNEIISALSRFSGEQRSLCLRQLDRAGTRPNLRRVVNRNAPLRQAGLQRSHMDSLHSYCRHRAPRPVGVAKVEADSSRQRLGLLRARLRGSFRLITIHRYRQGRLSSLHLSAANFILGYSLGAGWARNSPSTHRKDRARSRILPGDVFDCHGGADPVFGTRLV